MDHFGIGLTLYGMALNYTLAARQTGRTTSLVESVKDGDRIVCYSPQEAAQLKRLCQARGVTVDCVVINLRSPETIFQYPTPSGRTIFDHVWVEHYYLRVLAQAQRDLDFWARESSANGAAHRETRQAYEALARWGHLGTPAAEQNRDDAWWPLDPLESALLLALRTSSAGLGDRLPGL